MFKNIFSAMILTVLMMTLASCGKDKPFGGEGQEAATAKNDQIYAVDTLNSRVEWKGFKLIKSENMSHFGTIKFESGEVVTKDSKLGSGTFVVDMSSLENVDLKSDSEQKSKLEAHLKSGDFFQVDKFPTASYQITKVTAADSGDYNTILDGNLTLKGITKPVRFLANVSISGGEISIATEPTDISREDFGLKFQMPAADGIIKDEITLQILIKALARK